MSVSIPTTAIVSLHAEGASRDEIIIALVSEHSLSLNAATRGYAATAKDEGWSSTPTSHKAEALITLSAQYPEGAGWDAIAVRNAVIELADRYSVQDSTARDYCKAYSTLVCLQHPVINPRTAIFEWFRDVAPTISEDERKVAYLEYAVGELNRSRSNANEYWKGYELHLYLSAS